MSAAAGLMALMVTSRAHSAARQLCQGADGELVHAPCVKRLSAAGEERAASLRRTQLLRQLMRKVAASSL
jgi:hypothetical protein